VSRDHVQRRREADVIERITDVPDGVLGFERVAEAEGPTSA
jgi:hypothetical protein